MPRKIFLLFGGIILLGAGCTSSPLASFDGEVNNQIWDGEWVMEKEVTAYASREFENELVGKRLFIDGATFSENYDQISGVENCESVGEFGAEIAFIDDHTATIVGKYVSLEPTFFCTTGDEGKYTLPHSLTDIGWELIFDGDQMTATAQDGPATIIQTYKRN